MTAIPELHAGTPFDDLDDYLALGRVGSLALSADGRRLVVAQSTLGEKATKYVTALWEIDPTGEFAARRLTRGRSGESNPTFTSDGDLLFTSSRPTQDEDDLPDDLWRLPARGGEAVVVARRGGGITGVRAARCAPRFVVTTGVLGRSGESADDERVRTERKEKKVSAILHTGYPIRYWDHDLGPDVPHLLSAPLDALAENGQEPELTDLTPMPGPALREANYALSDDGAFVVTSWTVPGPLASIRNILVRVDTETGARTVLVDDADADLSDPVISPDGRHVVFTRESHATPDSAPRFTLHRYSFDSGTVTEVAPGWDRWATSVVWLSDGSGLLVTADDRGRAPIFLLRDGADPTRVTTDDCAYTDLQVGPRRVDGVRAARVVRGAAAPGAHRHHHRCRVAAEGARRPPRTAGHADRGRDGRRRRRGTARVARGADRRLRPRAGASRAVGARRPPGFVEHLVVAMEPVAPGRAGIRRAAPGSGVVHRLRAGVPRAGLG
ncbi:Dipeptidyl-peptidase 5 [Rhodococcus opacus PD630]|nr:Dipeptidyl-peptidase 5 [Rhodococcus opacus PD630]